jgi:hypothetical protein
MRGSGKQAIPGNLLTKRFETHQQAAYDWGIIVLTIKQNFMETIRGGSPDRFVNQYEYVELFMDPIVTECGGFAEPGTTKTNDWGYTVSWREGEPGPFPLHDEKHLLLKDVTRWKEVLKRPDPTAYSDEMWAPIVAQAAAVDRKEKFVSPWYITGLFEKLHMMMGVENALISFHTEPEAMRELIDFLADWEIDAAKEEIRRYHPNALYHHDDWGSQDRLMLSPAMFEEFFLEPYKRVYGFWKANGAEVIIHHSDSYAAELVPFMIEMGVDVFQGATSENNIPALLRKYGGQISIHGGLDNGKFDKPDWSVDAIRAELKKLFEVTNGGKYLIPGFTMGGPGSTFPGAYEAASAEIDAFSKIYFS